MNQKSIDPIEAVEKAAQKTQRTIEKETRPVARKYPFLFGLSITFGVVFVLYGFERMADSIPFFHNNPIIVLIIGLAVLFLTGTLYRWLRKQGS